MQVKLRVTQGSKAGKEIRIPGPVFRIGRSEDCHLRPKSDAISRRHCEIRIDENRILVKDLGSKNGTLINDERIEGEVELKMGNLLRVGRLEFEVVIDHSFGGAKKPKVRDIKQAAVRTAEGSANDNDISDWLDEGDSAALKSNDPDTRQFKLDSDEQQELDDTAIASSSETQARVDTEGEDAVDETQKAVDEKRSQKPKKLPSRPSVQADSSKQAASDMLKKFFNRG